MDLGITGRTALVVGADSGIGWHTVKLLLEEGATVVISDQNADELATAAKKLKAPEGKLFAFDADITSLDALASLHERVQDAVGDIAAPRKRASWRWRKGCRARMRPRVCS